MIFKSYLVEKNFHSIKKNLVLFYGENVGLKDDFKKSISVVNKEVEVFKLTQEEIIKNSTIFFNKFSNISLFGTEKIFLIDQVNDKILELIKEIEIKIDTHRIYLFSDILDKKSKIRNYFEKSKNCAAIACYADNEINIKQIIQDKLKSYTGLNPTNINLIIDKTNLDRVKLNNELNKITTYFSNKIITTEKLEVLLNTKINDNFNLLKDEALIGNKFKTNKLLSDTNIDSEKNIFYLALINQRLNKLEAVTKLTQTTTLENAIDKLKPPIFWKDKPNFLAQARKWNINKIKTVLNKTYELEIEFKSNAMLNKNTLMKKLLVDICALANS